MFHIHKICKFAFDLKTRCRLQLKARPVSDLYMTVLMFWHHYYHRHCQNCYYGQVVVINGHTEWWKKKSPPSSCRWSKDGHKMVTRWSQDGHKNCWKKVITLVLQMATWEANKRWLCVPIESWRGSKAVSSLLPVMLTVNFISLGEFSLKFMLDFMNLRDLSVERLYTWTTSDWCSEGWVYFNFLYPLSSLTIFSI